MASGFTYLERRTACLCGWARRFWQASTDHRGVPGSPGRVVTLTPMPEARCWGLVYRLDADTAFAELVKLDEREKGGYIRRDFMLSTRERSRVTALTYFASPKNPHYLGPAPLPHIAAQVRTARGPSGTNIDYVLHLAAALRGLGVTDPHVMALEALL